jgi:hypothetical protein
VNETSWAHVWRLHFCYLRTGYDSTNIFIFLLMCKKQAPGIVHCGYYVCYYLHTNTLGKYLKSFIEHGADVVSIKILNYRLLES